MTLVTETAVVLSCLDDLDLRVETKYEYTETHSSTRNLIPKQVPFTRDACLSASIKLNSNMPNLYKTQN